MSIRFAFGAILRIAPALALASLVAIMAFGPVAARAQGYPSKSVRLVQGFGVGGNADTIARIIAQAMSASMEQQVIVEPKTGAGGNIATEFVARSRADGYTLILLTGGHAVSAGLYKSLPFDPVNDFAMVSTVTFFPFVISVRADHPAKSLGDLIAMARSTPRGLRYSSVGVGSTQHLTGELLASTAGVEMLHVPYRGGPATVEGLLRGDVDLMIDTVTLTVGQIRGGRVRGVAVTNPTPWPSLPGVPTVAETLKGFDVRSWTGLAAPKGTPPEVVDRLNAEVRRALAQPEVRKRIEDLGNEVRASAPEEMRAHIASEIAKWKRVIDEARIERQ